MLEDLGALDVVPEARELIDLGMGDLLYGSRRSWVMTDGPAYAAYIPFLVDEVEVSLGALQAGDIGYDLFCIHVGIIAQRE
jgi:hypothetical protein